MAIYIQGTVQLHAEMMRELFEPGSIAVVGAAREENKVGHIVLRNIVSSGFTGKTYPVNPKSDEILGLRCYASISLVPDKIDLVIVTTPARTVPGIIEEAGQKGTKAVIVISAGFKETGKVTGPNWSGRSAKSPVLTE